MAETVGIPEMLGVIARDGKPELAALRALTDRLVELWWSPTTVFKTLRCAF